MKLFYISQEVNNDYDTYDGAVVAAEDEDTARNMRPSTGDPMAWDDKSCTYHWCDKPSDVKVDYIGEAAIHVPAGVICSSYNNG